MLKKLIHVIRVWYWRDQYHWHCTGVYHYSRIEPSTFHLYMEMAKADYYKFRLAAIGEIA